jgi:hypothetical protein
MVQDQDFIRIRNISLIILAILVVLYVILFFTLPSDISLAIIISSLLAFIVFIVTLAYYRWIAGRKIIKAARSVMISFLAKIIIFGAIFYLLVRLDIVNMMAFTISFVVFFTIFLNVEIFMIYKRLLFK